MADIKLTDPLGRIIALHDRTWYGHILRGHPEMEPCRRSIEETITNPCEIRHSLSNQDCRQYYSVKNEKELHHVVIVDVSLLLVKTAHFVKTIKGGELEWSRQTQSKEQ